MPTPKSVEEVASAIEHMNQQEREELLLRMAKMGDLIEDLEDVADLVRTAREPSRPYEEFISDLRSEGRDV